MKQRRVLSVCGVVLLMSAIAMTAPTSEPETAGGPATLRRLNQAQYMRSIQDIFGPGITVPGRFDPPLREEGGLLAISASEAAVTSSGLEQFDVRAREISAQVLAAERRQSVMPCAPTSVEVFDTSCATQFVGKYGRLLFRRPLDADEMKSALAVADSAVRRTGNFYSGLQAALGRLLLSPNFIFRVEQAQPNRAAGGRLRLNDYSLASRISFLLWDTTPDDALLDAAARGALRTPAGLARQVDRLMASPRFEQGLRAFFADMFAYDQFDSLSKDQLLFPIYSSQLAKDAQEQALRTIVDLVVNKGDYRDLFTTKKTFMNRNLGALYQVPVSTHSVAGWAPYTFGPDDPRAGLLTLAAFLMLDTTHEARSSPTIRGKTVRELFLCQKVPPPPGNVDFTGVDRLNDPRLKTFRDRLTAHRTNPTCAGCHAITDPIGLAAEHYDAIGSYRTLDNGAPIDASGTFERKNYNDVIGLAKILRDSPALPRCVTQRVFEYGVGRSVAVRDSEWLAFMSQKFAQQKYAVPALMRDVATSDAFQAVSAEGIASQKH